MKRFTLKLHQSNFSEESLVLNAKDFNDVKKNDIVKIYSCDEAASDHLVLKVKALKDNELQKNTISIEQTIASQFNLHAFQSVYVVKVDPEDISLNMVEVLFKDQYVSRSDMWRLKRHLVDSCTCVNEKVEFCDIRAQVNELWIGGKCVKCGLVTDNTRVVLRSATALVYIFIQMSREMWDFDAYGQLQFEKAVNGFLKDLFTNWKEKCYHEFTLVLFSRSYFETYTIEEFPEEIRYIVQKDYRGLHYIDFYYCVAHHERREDCTPLLSRLKKLFSEYKSLVHIPNCPPSDNSTASEGNFLEAINMSLDVFDKHYLDRNFDRTGQLVLCVTPGVGVFDVDRDMTILTKERMIDNGIGSDLVCLGQQPLHAVPLFKFHQKISSTTNGKDPCHSFNIPHWINHSFYSLNPFLDKGTVGINHVPRANLLLKGSKVGKKGIQSLLRNERFQKANLPSLPAWSLEEFDDEIFHLPDNSYRGLAKPTLLTHNDGKYATAANYRKSSHRIRTISDSWKQHSNTDDTTNHSHQTTPLHIPILIRSRDNERITSSVGPATNLEKYFSTKEESSKSVLLVGSAHSFCSRSSKVKCPSKRALINPFVASCNFLPITSNRRRWVHTYPDGQPYDPTLMTKRKEDGWQGLYRGMSKSDQCEEGYNSDTNSSVKTSRLVQSSQITIGSVNSSELSYESTTLTENFAEVANHANAGHREFPWSPAINWKTLRFPACLPITNDFFPSKQRLNNDYMEQSYNLIPDHDESAPYTYQDAFLSVDGDQGGSAWTGQSLQPVTTRELFLELVNQRLCQGFQLVVPMLKHRTHYDSLSMYFSHKSPMSLQKETSFTSANSSSPIYGKEDEESYTLNHGRQYHVVSLNGENEICVKIYKPRHLFFTSAIEYKYFLWAVGRDRYRMTKVKFAHEQYESYHWNYQDNCVCSGGADMDFKITESIKYWRGKFFVIPSLMSKLRSQKLEAESASNEGRKTRYDIFSTDEPPDGHLWSEIDGMVKFFNFINKVRHASGTVTTQRSPRLAKDFNGNHSYASSANLMPGSLPQPAVHKPSESNSSFLTRHLEEDMIKPASLPSTGSREGLYAQDKRESFESKMYDCEKKDDETNVSNVSEEIVIAGGNTQDDIVKLVMTAIHDEKRSFPFLQPQRKLHSKLFLSIDAIRWCLRNDLGIDKISEAVDLFEGMRQANCICHASGDGEHPFVYGYFIFYLTPDVSKHEGDRNIHNFEYQWLELELKWSDDSIFAAPLCEVPRNKRKSVLSSLLEEETSKRRRYYSGVRRMKTVLISLNNKNKTSRSEWCQIQHPATIMAWRGSFVFSFTIQWMVATATCLFEMLHGWLREANRCNLCMFPCPGNPFAFPNTEKDASPLHCPLFVPLNLTIITSLKDLIPEIVNCKKRIIDFMEKISIRFGFLRYYAAASINPRDSDTENSWRFVHYTSQVFLEIPITVDLKVQGRTVATRNLLSSVGLTGKCSARPAAKDSPVKMSDCGFYFSVNHMLTKRWRTAACEDCPVNDLEADFIAFCSGSDDRLQDFYKTLYAAD